LTPLSRSSQPRIAIISSYMGSQQHTGSGAYFHRASKAGANNLMVTLTNELRDQGIAVAAYHPGWVQTDMGGASADLTPQESATALLARFEALDMAHTGCFINYDGTPLPL
ncbi:MAG: SDR family NAD(P)-dependent oxidoreductase, partial [Burkholderiaceae bacterium]